jgi:transcriptional regulator with GAF, ATPase, and Fis domain
MLAFHASRPRAGGARFCLAGADEISIGSGVGRGSERRREAGKERIGITVDCRAMSRRHARLHRTPEGWVVEDAGSRNGVHVNGQRIDRGAILQAGDLVTLGRAFFLLEHHDTEDLSDLDAADVTSALPGMLTLSPGHAAELSNLAAIARTAAAVTLVGETGTGKELVARAVHRLSGRAGPYAAVNCAGLARTLIESELFGYVKGAFSGAAKDHPGHIQAADRGTLLFDEILAAPAELQAALLRTLQEREVTPVGARAPVPVDVRFVAAAQRPLADAVAKGGFRDDLRARLEGFVLDLPPLRHRLADIGIFVAHALRSSGAEVGGATASEREDLHFTLPAALRLLRHRWPGNIRELAAAVDRARTLARDGAIDEEHLLLPAAPDPDGGKAGPDKLRQELVATLRATGGDVSATAQRLGRNRTLVHRWLRRLGIDAGDFRDGKR